MMQQRSTKQRSTIDLSHLTIFKMLVSRSVSAVLRLSVKT